MSWPIEPPGSIRSTEPAVPEAPKTVPELVIASVMWFTSFKVSCGVGGFVVLGEHPDGLALAGAVELVGGGRDRAGPIDAAERERRPGTPVAL